MTNYKNIPDELQRLDQWVCVREDSKIPMRAFENKAASCSESQSWSSFDKALNAVAENRYSYCGFVFADNGIVGVDIDCGFDEDGFLTPLAAKLIGMCKSYTEISRSGRGTHILLKGDLPFKGKNNQHGVEIYKTARYFIMTGNTLVFKEMISNQDAIDYIVENCFDESREPKSAGKHECIYAGVWGIAEKGKIKLRPEYPPIQQGARNISLTSIAGSMHNQGYSKEQIFDELIIVNDMACKPPVSRYELQTIVNSVSRYRR